jgi:23S rRNA pseudouridine2605 synthase
MPVKVRLNKFLRDCQLGSRRKCEKLVLGGLVTVGGKAVTEMATLVDPAADRVEVGGKRVRPVREQVYVAANKPRGVVVTASDPQERQTIYERMRGLPVGMFCVGRLDMDSEGLILLTNDGKLCFRLAHPKSAIERVYEVEVEGKPDGEAIESLARGVVLEDGTAKASSVEVAARGRDSFNLRLVLTEGRKREVRRMVAACGMNVRRLRRIRFGSVSLGDLPSGSWRRLTREEVRGLRRLVGEAHEAAAAKGRQGKRRAMSDGEGTEH